MFLSSSDFDVPPKRSTHLALTPAFYSMVKRVRFGSIDIQHATIEEVLWGLDLARRTLTVTNDDCAALIHAHNPDCFRIVRENDFAQSPMIAYLPLNADGLTALVGGRFDTMHPDTALICQQGEQPEALYVWLIYVPGKMVSGLRFLEELQYYAPGVPVFTRPENPVAGRIMDQCGFQNACELFPSIPEGLNVILPTGNARESKPATSVRVARTIDDLLKAFSIRTATYMSEQHCPYEEEFDGNDLCGTHLIGEVDGEPAGCVRIRYFGDFAKLERLAVRPDQRRSRLMFQLVKAAFDHCRRKGFTRLYAHAREDLVPAWERFGAKLVANRRAFTFSGVRFREMMIEFEAMPRAIRFGEDPMLLIRPEGEWDSLGPIDRGQLISMALRQDRIAGSVRRLDR
jgi:predicted GNAT family N-acyltransferase